MDVPVAAQLYFVFFQHFQYFRAFIALIFGRIVEKNVFFPVPRRLQRRLQPQTLPGKYLFVVFPALFLLIKPAAGAAKSHAAVIEKVIVEDIYGAYAVLGKKLFGFCGRRPPIIVVALEYYLFSGQPVDL